MLAVCCDLTPYETSRWLELKENVTRSGTGSITHGTNATPERAHRNGQDRIRMSARAYISTPGNDAVAIGRTEVLFRPSFSLCCLRNTRRSTRWLRYGVAEQSTMRITRPPTAQSERALVRLIDTPSLIAVCIPSHEKNVAHHP